ncbi:hypothetical protein GJAV_G00078190 [Gymnothorax javanicus]|nr:hypothetical protein GJAV_G00078190 [Gymnothorax javanicus]
MQNAASYGLDRLPNIELADAALALTPGEAFRPDARCPLPQCHMTDDQIIRSYDTAAQISCIDNSMSHLILALSNTLQTLVADHSAQSLSESSLQAFLYLSRELDKSLVLLRNRPWSVVCRLHKLDGSSLACGISPLLGRGSHERVIRRSFSPGRSPSLGRRVLSSFASQILPWPLGQHNAARSTAASPPNNRGGEGANNDNVTPAVSRIVGGARVVEVHVDRWLLSRRIPHREIRSGRAKVVPLLSPCDSPWIEGDQTAEPRAHADCFRLLPVSSTKEETRLLCTHIHLRESTGAD